ncbi:MAG: ABC transporter ATP-binding protein, partial [Candidatus Krumholzibacteria bacterium]|nr:ABC transporter ATP-binding protein [Candidatus Krumholzibacteria bacterium]
MIQAKDIKKVYEVGVVQIDALVGIDLEVDVNEYVAIMGPSGSGKSTFMNILGCLDTPTEGSYCLNGNLVSNLGDDELARIRNKEIGFVFQTFNLLPRATALQNVELPLVYGGVPASARRERAMESLRAVGLLDRAAHRPNELSGGQRQRVAMGRAMVRNPAVFLFDEPLSNLDAKMRVEMRTEILHLHRRLKTTMLYVTHDQVEAMTLGDRIVVMREGRIEQVGPPAVVFDHPRTMFVARFIGAP